jgi:hypothetical protein
LVFADDTFDPWIGRVVSAVGDAGAALLDVMRPAAGLDAGMFVVPKVWVIVLSINAK